MSSNECSNSLYRSDYSDFEADLINLGECEYSRELINQIENDIFYDGNEPFSNEENPCFEYSFFIFYKPYEISIEDEFDNLPNGWYWIGTSWLGPYKEIQIGGPGPVNNLYIAEMILRNKLIHYQNDNLIESFKMRRRYPRL
jgi:hypothetical protein